MKIGKYEKVTFRSEKRINQLKAVISRVNAISPNSVWSATMAKHSPTICKIQTILMEHRIYNK